MLSIATNLMSQNSARHLGKSYNNLSVSVARLSSGLRINGARDDAAGLAVRELIRADVARIRQGSRNAQDAISMLQTAEGAMGVVDNILVRMEELAEQAATESYSNDQRSIMNQEFTQLTAEIDRIAGDTKFNNIALLDNTTGISIQVGSADASKDITLTGADMSSTGLSLSGDKGVAFAQTNGASAVTATTVTSGDVVYSFRGGAQVLTVTFSGGATTVQGLVDQINAKSRADYDYDAAELRTDSLTGAVMIAVSDNTAGVGAVSGTDDGTVADTLGILDGGWTGVAGSGTDSSIDSVANAKTALTTVASAIRTKDKYRAKLGYWMNRLEGAADVADIAAENLSAAESRISDVDVASEMATMTRNQVLAQAGISMLAQANQMPQMALKLLG